MNPQAHIEFTAGGSSQKVVVDDGGNKFHGMKLTSVQVTGFEYDYGSEDLCVNWSGLRVRTAGHTRITVAVYSLTDIALEELRFIRDSFPGCELVFDGGIYLPSPITKN